MDDRGKQDRSGAYDWEELVDEQSERPPEEFENPAGIGRGDCDDERGSSDEAACSVEIEAQVEDLFMEETKPGLGIAGFEGEEDGGG